MKRVETSCLCCLVGVIASLTLASASQAQTLTWTGPDPDSFQLVDGQLVSTAINGCNGETITATFSDPEGIASPPFPNEVIGTIAIIGMDGTTAGQLTTFSLTFGGGFPVENLAFNVFDVDQNDDAGSFWTDQITISASFGATNQPVALACTDGDGTCSFNVAGNVATGSANNPAFLDDNGNLAVSIAGPVDSVSFTARIAGPGTNLQFTGISNFTFDCSTTPVSISTVDAQITEDGVDIAWSTSSETANVGFHVYGETAGGWERLNERLIPSRQLDSLVPQHYQFVARNVDPLPRRIKIAEVDYRVRQRMHGPFTVGIPFGHPPAAAPLDWQRIRAQNEKSAGWVRQRRAKNTASPVAELWLDRDGIYRVAHRDLLAAGIDFTSIPAAELALIDSEGRPVPIRVETGSDGARFDSNSFIEWVGRGADSLYTSTNVYLLKVAASEARRVLDLKLRPGVVPQPWYLAETRLEEQRFYSFGAPNGDPWYTEAILAYTQPVVRDYDLLVTDIADDRDATLRVGLWGVTDWPDTPDHHVIVALNGIDVGEATFDGLVDASFEIGLPAGLLMEGNNQVTITSLGDTGVPFDLVHLDHIAIDYRRRPQAQEDRHSYLSVPGSGHYAVHGFSKQDLLVYGTSDKTVARLVGTEIRPENQGFVAFVPQHPTIAFEAWIATNGAIAVPDIRPARDTGELLSGTVDYLIVSHPAFIEGLDPLVAARRQEGFEVALVDVEAAYARYTGGVFDPEAIRQLIADAVVKHHARYVLLVGGDSYDYFDHLGIGSESYIPSIYIQAHPVVRYAPSDSAFADIDSDGLPDVALGRFPVRDNDELSAMIGKTLSYSGRRQEVVFAADRSDTQASYAAISDQMLRTLPPTWAVQTAYLDVGLETARRTLLGALETGSSLANYIGHSGPTAWTFDGLFTVGDAQSLSFQEPAVFLQWGCWGAYHSVPQYNTLSHELLIRPNSGAAAVFGASTLTEISSDRELALRLMPELVQPGQTLGEVILKAKRALANEPDKEDVLFGMTLLGDPALVVVP